MAKKLKAFRLDELLVNDLQELANKNNRSLSNYVEDILKKSVEVVKNKPVINELLQPAYIAEIKQQPTEIANANTNANESNNLLTLAQIKSYFKIEQKFSEMKAILKENKVPFEEVAGGDRIYNITGFDIKSLFNAHGN